MTWAVMLNFPYLIIGAIVLAIIVLPIAALIIVFCYLISALAAAKGGGDA